VFSSLVTDNRVFAGCQGAETTTSSSTFPSRAKNLGAERGSSMVEVGFKNSFVD
jgi:hypothetical protein